jgi:hypothetical protein
MAGTIDAMKIHVGPGKFWLNVCAPAPGRRLVIDADGNPTSPVWQATTVYTPGEQIVDSNGNIQECIVGGQSNGSQPTWGTTMYSEKTDGGATWRLVVIGPATVFAGASQGPATFTNSPKNQPIMADQATAGIDAVMVQELESIELTLLETDFNRMRNYFTHGSFASGTDTALPSGAQSYEEIAFGGVRTVPKPSVALISPRRDVVSKYVVAQLYRAYQADQIQLPFTREKESLFKVKFEGLWVDWRPVGDRVGKVYRQTD